MQELPKFAARWQLAGYPDDHEWWQCIENRLVFWLPERHSKTAVEPDTGHRLVCRAWYARPFPREDYLQRFSHQLNLMTDDVSVPRPPYILQSVIAFGETNPTFPAMMPTAVPPRKISLP